MAYVIELSAPRQVHICQLEVAAPGSHEVRVRTLFSGISAGTELATFRGTNPHLEKRWDAESALFVPGDASSRYPVDVWGYSEVGVVDEVGDDVTAVVPGDVVWGIWGHRSDALLTEQALARHRLPPGLEPVVGTFDRVGAVALNAVLAAQVNVGESVAVFGQGVIGLLATQLLVAQGATVFAIDTVADRLQLAQRFGATPVAADDTDVAQHLRAATGGRGVDRVIELTGSYLALHQAIRVAGPDGEVVTAGFYQGAGAALGLGEEFHHNRVSLKPSQIGAVPAHLRQRWTRERLHETVIELFSAGRMDPAPLVTHLVPARDAAKAYELVDRPPPGLLQVILDFSEGAR